MHVLFTSHLSFPFPFLNPFSNPPTKHSIKVLDVEGVSIETIPGSLINLFNLSHLNLRDTKVRELPKSMERLHSIQTLDVRNTNVTRLPSGISKLLKL
ncbi:hypothetical protein ACSBR1_011834 [Camellia fascicularis]